MDNQNMKFIELKQEDLNLKERKTVLADDFLPHLTPEQQKQPMAVPAKTRKKIVAIFAKMEKLAFYDFSAENARKNAEEALEEYFETMVGFLKDAERERNSFQPTTVDHSSAVEALYLMGCKRDRKTNSYFIPVWHPVRMLNRLLDADLKRLLEKDDRDQAVLKAIFDDKNRNRRQIKLFCRNQVYETFPEDAGDYIRAYPFKQKEGNTEIPYLRIWEKLAGYQKYHPECDLIKVAVFGELAGEPDLAEALLGSETKVEWISFENIPFIGEYFFQDNSDGQIYDLSEMEDVRELSRNYNILLFLDVNCFYRQWQSIKTVEERNERSHCQWYLDRSREQTAFKEKAAYYRNIYHHVGLWLNSLRKKNSSSHEFDSLLFSNLQNVSNTETDIYLYIKGENRIASYNIAYSAECNDEYYEGKPLLVYKIAKTQEKDFAESYKKFLVKSMEKNPDYSVSVKLWKILKSIGNKYCDDFLSNGGTIQDISFQSRLIKILEDSRLVLKYSVDADNKEVVLTYGVVLAETDVDMPDDLQQRMEKLSEEVLSHALETESMYCIRKYFKELLVQSIIANAGSIGDLVFAHIWSQPWINTRLKKAGRKKIQPVSECDYSGKHKLHRTVYVIIERLEWLRMRTVPDMRGFFLDTLRNIVSSEVSEKDFEQTLHCIADCCRQFHYTDSSLFFNSTLIDGQEEINYG